MDGLDWRGSLALPTHVACALRAVMQVVFLPCNVRSAHVRLLSLCEAAVAREPDDRG